MAQSHEVVCPLVAAILGAKIRCYQLISAAFAQQQMSFRTQLPFGDLWHSPLAPDLYCTEWIYEFGGKAKKHIYYRCIYYSNWKREGEEASRFFCALLKHAHIKIKAAHTWHFILTSQRQQLRGLLRIQMNSWPYFAQMLFASLSSCMRSVGQEKKKRAQNILQYSLEHHLKFMCTAVDVYIWLYRIRFVLMSVQYLTCFNY